MPRPVVIPDSAKIIELRGRLGLTQEQLAIKVGYAKRTIERLESGERTRRVTLLEVANCLGAEVDTLVIPLSYGLDNETNGRIEQWVDSAVEREEFKDLLKSVSMESLLAPPSSGAAGARLICQWSSGTREYLLRPNVTVAEFCAALREDVFHGRTTHRYLSLGVSRIRHYDPALTVLEVERRSGGRVKIYRSTGGGVLGTATSVPVSIVEALAHAAQGRTGLNARICRFYLWLFERAVFNRRWPSVVLGLLLGTVLRFVIAELNHMAWAYAESGTYIGDAGRMVEIILKVPNGLLSRDYFDTLGWVKYRQGGYSQALELIEKTALSETAHIYHLFFVLRALDMHAAADDIKLGFRGASSNGPGNLETFRVLAEDDTATGELPQKRARVFVPYFIRHAIQLPLIVWLYLVAIPITALVAGSILFLIWIVRRLRRKRNDGANKSHA